MALQPSNRFKIHAHPDVEGSGINLAAITAAFCVGPEAHPDPARRYWAPLCALRRKSL